MAAIPQDPAVLIVEDERQLADLYSRQLPDEYEVEVLHGGGPALEAVDDGYDVVLLDRRMPEVSGDEVLQRMRERGIDSRVVVVTAVDPDFDIGQMPFDDYLCKPIGAGDLVDAVEQQLELRTRNDRLDEYLRLQAKMMLLEVEKRDGELERSDEYRRLRERVRELEPAVEESVDDFEEIRREFDGLNRVA